MKPMPGLLRVDNADPQHNISDNPIISISYLNSVSLKIRESQNVTYFCLAMGFTDKIEDCKSSP